MLTVNFENLPIAVADLKKEVEEMKALLLQKAELKSEINNPFNIKEVSKLTSLSVPTLYGYCQRNEIPYHKKGNRLYFFKSDIIEWIKTGKQKNIKELEEETDKLLSNNKKGLNYGK